VFFDNYGFGLDENLGWRNSWLNEEPTNQDRAILHELVTYFLLRLIGDHEKRPIETKPNTARSSSSGLEMLDGWEMNKRRQEGLRIMNKDRLLYPRGTSLSGNPEIRFKTHPNINKDLFPNENILGSKDPNRPFQVTESGDGLFKWRMQSKDVSAVPLTSYKCCPDKRWTSSQVLTQLVSENNQVV
nr:coatomer subunit delta-like [Tanacetum cinerariifolium]